MTDYRTRNRSNSIFSDDDRPGERWRDEAPRGERWRSEEHGWGGNPDRDRDSRRGSQEDRGFFERASDEVRSWFGDDEAERRREQDGRDTPGRRPEQGGQHGSRSERAQLRSNQAQSRGTDWGDDAQGGFGDGGFGGAQRGGSGGGEPRFANHHDESYRRWRDEQIAALDRDYDEYRSHRQQQFEQDFSTFRQSRQSPITSGGATLNQAGGDQTAQVSAHPAGTGVSAQQNAGDPTPGAETVTADQASESSSRSARTR